MSKRTLPAADVSARPPIRSRLCPAALDRWNPVLRGAGEEGEDVGVISILDVIGEDFFGEGVTARRIAAALRAIGPKPVRVDLNSPGGNFFEGLAIYNALREHPETVTVHVLGVAASAASVIAMAGDVVRMPRAGFLMIHNTWVVGLGDRNELRRIADWLEPFDRASADIYAARSGLAPAEVLAMMDSETWLGGGEAIDQGFADAFLPSDAARTEESADDPAARLRQASRDLRKLDEVLARAGMARSERRSLLKTFRGAPAGADEGNMPGAVPTGMPGAAVLTGIRSLLDHAKSLRTGQGA